MATLQPTRSSGISNITGDQLRFGDEVSLSADGATFAFERETFGPLLAIDISGGSDTIVVQRPDATYEYSAFDELTPINTETNPNSIEAAVRETIDDFDGFVAEVVDPVVEIVPFDGFSGLGLPELDQPALSADGRILAFAREGGIVVADLEAGVLTFPAVTSTAAQGPVPIGDPEASLGSEPALAGGGEVVVFGSDDPGLLNAAEIVGPGGRSLATSSPPTGSQILLKDLQSGALRLVSASATGQPGDGASREPAISGDGRLIAFTSEAGNLVRRDDNGEPDVFVKDLRSGRVTLVTTNPVQTLGNGASGDPEISLDGRYVAFTSLADNLVEGDFNGVADVFLKDLRTGEIRLVSTTADGAQRSTPSEATAISADGRLVGFLSQPMAVGSDRPVISNAFVKDMSTGTLFMVDTLAENPVDLAVLEVRVTDLALSGDGQTVGFAEASRDFRLPDEPELQDQAGNNIAAFFSDRQERALEFVQVDSVGIGLLVPLQPDSLAALERAAASATEALTLQPAGAQASNHLPVDGGT